MLHEKILFSLKCLFLLRIFIPGDAVQQHVKRSDYVCGFTNRSSSGRLYIDHYLLHWNLYSLCEY